MGIRKGFTLIETLVVLVISSLILSLSLLITHNFNENHYQNYLFWKEFHNEFELYESLVREHHSSVMIDFNTSSNQVNFVSSSPKIHQHTIKEPRDLTTNHYYKILINNKGLVNPDTVIWNVKGQRKLSQRFQLGWGMYTIEDSK